MNKPSSKSSPKKISYKEHRRQEAEKQQKLNRRLMLFSAIFVVALIAVILIFKPKPGPIEFDYNKLPVLGSVDAPIKIVEFGDYKCPVCQYFNQEIKPQLKKDYIDTGLVSFYFMNFAFIGADSLTAAEAAQAAYHQSNDAFWPFHDAIYTNQGNERIAWATPDMLTRLAGSVPGLDADKIKTDLTNKTYSDEVGDHNAKARAIGINSTPSLVINGVIFRDSALDYAKVKATIDAELEKVKGKKEK